MSKRFLCSKHMYHLTKEGKDVKLSTEKCSICRWENRPWTLKDFSVEFKNISENLLISYDNPYYDPHGITFLSDLEKTMKAFIKAMHPSYRDNFIKEITSDNSN